MGEFGPTTALLRGDVDEGKMSHTPPIHTHPSPGELALDMGVVDEPAPRV